MAHEYRANDAWPNRVRMPQQSRGSSKPTAARSRANSKSSSWSSWSACATERPMAFVASVSRSSSPPSPTIRMNTFSIDARSLSHAEAADAQSRTRPRVGVLEAREGVLQGPLALQLVGRDARGEPGERAAAARPLQRGLEIRAERGLVVRALEVCDELVARRVPIFAAEVLWNCRRSVESARASATEPARSESSLVDFHTAPTQWPGLAPHLNADAVAERIRLEHRMRRQEHRPPRHRRLDQVPEVPLRDGVQARRRFVQ